jgi:hypothetical protein
VRGKLTGIGGLVGSGPIRGVEHKSGREGRCASNGRRRARGIGRTGGKCRLRRHAGRDGRKRRYGSASVRGGSARSRGGYSRSACGSPSSNCSTSGDARSGRGGGGRGRCCDGRGGLALAYTSMAAGKVVCVNGSEEQKSGGSGELHRIRCRVREERENNNRWATTRSRMKRALGNPAELKTAVKRSPSRPADRRHGLAHAPKSSLMTAFSPRRNP